MCRRFDPGSAHKIFGLNSKIRLKVFYKKPVSDTGFDTGGESWSEVYLGFHSRVFSLDPIKTGNGISLSGIA